MRIGLCGLLFAIFLTLKLCAVIDWSWWWVAAPLWGPAALYLLLLFGFVLFAGACWTWIIMADCWLTNRK